MSRRIFRKDDVVVTMGYDRPLDYIYCNVHRRDEVVYSSLHDENAGTHQQDLDYYRPVLASLGIEPPESMYTGVAFDQETRSGNLIVEHPITLERFLELFCDCSESHVPKEFPNVKPGVLHRGSTLRLNIDHEIDGWGLEGFLPEGFYGVEAWTDYPLRVAWKHDQLRAIVTYEADDVTVKVDNNDESYAAQMRSATLFCCGTDLRQLTCCLCGESAGQWLQHHNLEPGLGVCYACVIRTRERKSGPGSMNEKEIQLTYGIEGVNWGRM